MRLKGQAGVLVIITLIIGGIIGLSIIDTLAEDVANVSGAINESVTLSTTAITLANVEKGVVSASETITNSTGYALVRNTDYNITYSTGVVGINSADFDAMEANVTYNYVANTAFESSLSRTIMTYIVPIGLLAIIGVAAAFAGMRR